MASKGKGKGKNGKLEFDILKKGTKQHEGALDNSYLVLAQMKNSNWYKARIIDCRLAKDYDQRKKKVESSYEYYIHYEDFDRRMDEWISSNRIQMTDQLIQDEPLTKKKKKVGEEKKTEGQDAKDHEGMNDEAIQQHQEVTKFKTIDQIEIGKFTCPTWYYSPFVEGYHNIESLYFCEFCLSFYVSREELKRHNKQCILTHPPGDEVYRDDTIPDSSISVFEVDGYKNATYCENLCYLSKLFLDHKNLYWNTDPFLFFVLCENDHLGSHLVGYFSKEKESTQGWNLNCILTLPCYQRKGYGKFLISFSYELSLIEQKLGTPERPLSDLGRQSYISWWTQRIIDFIKQKPKDYNFCVNDIVKETGIKEQDILTALEAKFLIKYIQGQIAICTDQKFLDKVYKEAGRPGFVLYPLKIHWIPFRFKWDKDIQFNYPIYNPIQ